MKFQRIVSGLVVSCIGAAALTGCSPAKLDAANDDRPVVLTTFTVLADIASNVAGEHLRVESITREGAEIHEYEPSPSDIARASSADLILDNGLGLELWFEKFLADADAPHVQVTTGIDPIAITEDSYAGQPNPHAWMSPSNVEIYVDNMVTAFSDLDPDHAEHFRANGDAYKRELREVQEELNAALAPLPEHQRALVTCEGAFSYLARDANLTEHYIWPTNSDDGPTPQRIASTIDFVNENDVPAVFCESTVPDAPMRQVVEATDATFGGILYVDSLSTADGPVPTYLELISHDATTIAQALTGGES